MGKFVTIVRAGRGRDIRSASVTTSVNAHSALDSTAVHCLQPGLSPALGQVID
jgi:hypothetical protein